MLNIWRPGVGRPALELFFTSALNFCSVTDKGGAPSASEFAGIGLQFAVSIVLFVFAGQWLDRRMGTGPLFLILGAFVGAGGAFYSMYRKLMAFQKSDPPSDRAGKDKRDLDRKP
jgi:F0F1-type ATP synthase assembly protein I